MSAHAENDRTIIQSTATSASHISQNPRSVTSGGESVPIPPITYFDTNISSTLEEDPVTTGFGGLRAGAVLVCGTAAVVFLAGPVVSEWWNRTEDTLLKQSQEFNGSSSRHVHTVAPLPSHSIVPETTPAPQPTMTEPTPTETIQAVSEKQISCVKQWSLERQIGQLLLVPVKTDGSYALRKQASVSATEQVIRDYHIGGVIITEGTQEERKDVRAEYTRQGAFELPMLVADTNAGEYYGLNDPRFLTTADVGAPVPAGEVQPDLPEAVQSELQGGANAIVFMSDTARAGKAPLPLSTELKAIVNQQITAVQSGKISTDALTKQVALNLAARGIDASALTPSCS